MLNLRALFSKYRIAYVEKGPNCAKGNINIQCCLCGSADRSHHLAIREETGQWYCFRNPRHHGHNLAFILKKLGIPAKEYAHLVFEEEAPAVYDDKHDYTAFKYFQPAQESEEVISYLESRMFSDPIRVCEQFNLKYAPEGPWAGRLIIPLTIGWTGRAMRPHQEIRYKAHCSENGFFLFKHRSTSCIITEGSMDAMRLGSVSTQFDVIAKCRISTSVAILTYLRETNYASIYYSPDQGVPYSQYRDEIVQIRSYCPRTEVEKLLPNKKDFGDTSESETRQILARLGERMVMGWNG